MNFCEAFTAMLYTRMEEPGFYNPLEESDAYRAAQDIYREARAEVGSEGDEYQRVEQIYMESNHMTKEDAYRMAQVVTIKEHEKMMARERKAEKAWVMENIIPAAAFIRHMSESEGRYSNLSYRSKCGNLYELRLEREINCGSVTLYELFINGEKIDTRSTGNGLLPSAEFQSYRSRWYNASIEQMRAIVGYIA